MLRRLVRAAKEDVRTDRMTIGDLIASLGEASFGWSLVVLALLNLLPLPLGFNMITSIPLILVTAQMALGFDKVRLPGFIASRSINRRGFQSLVLRLKPIFSWVERLSKPRLPMMLSPTAERAIGIVLFLASLALFLPIPLNTWLLAISLLVAGVGIVERDGLITLIGTSLAMAAVVLTGVLGSMIVIGADELIH